MKNNRDKAAMIADAKNRLQQKLINDVRKHMKKVTDKELTDEDVIFFALQYYLDEKDK